MEKSSELKRYKHLIGSRFGSMIIKKIFMRKGRARALVFQNGFLRTVRVSALLAEDVKGINSGWHIKSRKLKWCAKCRKKKRVSSFQNKRKTGRQSWCKFCMLEKNEEWRKDNRKHYLSLQQKQNLWRHHGIYWEDYLRILQKQKNRCALCGSKKPGGNGRWGVDHDHRCCKKTGESCNRCFRDLICSHCNIALGNVHDSIKTLKRMIAYLKKHNKRIKI